MKSFIIVLLIAVLSGCGTVGGTLSGMGHDLNRVGDWVKNR